MTSMSLATLAEFTTSRSILENVLGNMWKGAETRDSGSSCTTARHLSPPTGTDAAFTSPPKLWTRDTVSFDSPLYWDPFTILNGWKTVSTQTVKWCDVRTWGGVVGSGRRRSDGFVAHGDVSWQLPVWRATSFGPVDPVLIQLYWWWWAPRSCNGGAHTNTHTHYTHYSRLSGESQNQHTYYK